VVAARAPRRLPASGRDLPAAHRAEEAGKPVNHKRLSRASPLWLHEPSGTEPGLRAYPETKDHFDDSKWSLVSSASFVGKHVEDSIVGDIRRVLGEGGVAHTEAAEDIWAGSVTN